MESGTVREVKKWQLFLKGLEGKTTVINIEKTASVEDLFKIVNEKTGVAVDEMRIIYIGKQLQMKDEHGEKQYLNDYEIQNNANLALVLRLLGGSGERKILDDDVELSYAPDMITLEDDEDNPRAKMPCGHAIGPESLTAYCRSLLSVGKFEFRCPFADPYCGKLWDFFTIKRLAVLTANEQSEFETKISENYLRKHVQIQDCPKCSSYCVRNDAKDIRVICPLCSKKDDQKLFEFCWFCLKPWITNNAKDCGNDGCSKQDPRLKILKECSKKIVVGVPNCPSVRACPNCGLLIEHRRACKHMVCPCNQRFCFICLKKANSSGAYQCGAFNAKCEVAPIQSKLP